MTDLSLPLNTEEYLMRWPNYEPDKENTITTEILDSK